MLIFRQLDDRRATLGIVLMRKGGRAARHVYAKLSYANIPLSKLVQAGRIPLFTFLFQMESRQMLDNMTLYFINILRLLARILINIHKRIEMEK